MRRCRTSHISETLSAKAHKKDFINMKKYFLFSIIFIIFFSSNCMFEKIINDKNIKTIKVFDILKQEMLIELSDNQIIQKLIKKINNSNKEIIKFPGHYRIEVEYYNIAEKTLILINGKNIKINGITYKSKNNIEELINSLLK
jgi:hypothetical protein